MDRGVWCANSPWGHKELDVTERLTYFTAVEGSVIGIIH